MDEQTIIKLAQEAGIYYRDDYEFCEADRDGVPMEMMAKFAALVAAAEREACLKIAEDEAKAIITAQEYNPKNSVPWNQSLGVLRVADAIRARGKSK